MNNISKNISLSILSGILAFLAFPPFELSILGWVCFVPLLFVIRRTTSSARHFWYSYLAGVVFFGGLICWLVNVSVPGTIILVAVLALFFGIFGVVAGYVFKYSMDILVLPFVWVVLEYIRSNLFTGFPWGILGYCQYQNLNIIQIADITGAYGVSFLLIAFNAAIFSFLTGSKKKISCMVVSLLFILIATTYGIYRLDNLNVGGSARIGIVQGNIPQRLKWDRASAEDIINSYTDLTQLVVKDEPDIVIWPETSYPYLVEGKEEVTVGEISSLAAGTKVPLLFGAVYAEGDDHCNAASLFNADGTHAAKYYKTHLVPFGEYIPFEEFLTFLRGSIDKPIGDFKKGKEYTLFPLKTLRSHEGSDGTMTRQISYFKFGVMICFEDIFPYVAREYVTRGADFLVNITNDAWFGKTAASRQHLQASVFRAVENKVPVIRAANTGISCFISPAGKIYSSVQEDGKQIFISGFSTDEINMTSSRSSYSACGDQFVYFCAFLLVLPFIAEAIRSRRS